MSEGTLTTIDDTVKNTMSEDCSSDGHCALKYGGKLNSPSVKYSLEQMAIGNFEVLPPKMK